MSEGTDILFSPPVSRFSDRPGRGVRPRAKRLHGVPRDARMAPSCCIAATVESGRKKAGVEPRPVVRRRNPGRTPPPPFERREANGDGVPVWSIIIGAPSILPEDDRKGGV